MEHEEKTQDMAQQVSVRCDTGYCSFHCMGKHYKDKWGDEWIRGNETSVLRVRDWHVGGWFNGKGLTLFSSDNQK